MPYPSTWVKALRTVATAFQTSSKPQLPALLRYDNEAGKGDHRHVGGAETPYRFTTPDAVLADFWDDVETWRPE